jgi:hypothetical protein
MPLDGAPGCKPFPVHDHFGHAHFDPFLVGPKRTAMWTEMKTSFGPVCTKVTIDRKVHVPM